MISNKFDFWIVQVHKTILSIGLKLPRTYLLICCVIIACMICVMIFRYKTIIGASWHSRPIGYCSILYMLNRIGSGVARRWHNGHNVRMWPNGGFVTPLLAGIVQNISASITKEYSNVWPSHKLQFQEPKFICSFRLGILQ